MKNTSIQPRIFSLIMAILFLGLTESFAQCVDFNGGPYTNLNTVMPGGIAPCDPNCGTPYTVTAFEVWSSEAYIFYGVIEGNSYTVDICSGPGAGTWLPELTVGPFDGTGIAVGGLGTPIVDGNIVGNCSLTFTASTSGDYLIVINTDLVCGGPENGINNGFLSVQCNGIASCDPPTCGALPIACDPGEDYCSCTNDCPCPTIDVVFIDYSTGTPALSAVGGFAYCADEAFIPVGANPTPEKIYIPLAIGTTLSCVSQYDVTVANGILSQSDGTALIPITASSSFVVFWLEITDADLIASGGTTTVTVTDQTNGPGGPVPCLTNFTVNIPALNNFSTDVATTCPGICAPADGTAVYDCMTNSIDVTITDVGSPTAPNSYEITVVGEPGIPAQTITGAMTYTMGPGLVPNSTYTVSISDGLTPGCDTGITNIYPDCYTAPADCTDVILEGDLETVINWTESSTDNSGTQTGIPAITTDVPLAGAQSAWLGGYGGSAIGTGEPYTVSISQSVTLSSGGNVTLYYWLLLGLCDSADDVLNVLVDGAVVPGAAVTGGDLECGSGTWTRRMVDLSAYADGAAHIIELASTEVATNGANSNFFVDEIVIEDCSSSDCPPDFAGGNALTGTETGTADYETDGVIESTQQILSNATVDYDSKLEISLNNDFEVDANADFHGFIEGCGGANITGQDDLNRRIANTRKSKMDILDLTKSLNENKNTTVKKKVEEKTFRNTSR